jgi:tagatose-1,6-bisphosphate aldolase
VKITVRAIILLWDTDNIKIKYRRYTHVSNVDKERRKPGLKKFIEITKYREKQCRDNECWLY